MHLSKKNQHFNRKRDSKKGIAGDFSEKFMRESKKISLRLCVARQNHADFDVRRKNSGAEEANLYKSSRATVIFFVIFALYTDKSGDHGKNCLSSSSSAIKCSVLSQHLRA